MARVQQRYVFVIAVSIFVLFLFLFGHNILGTSVESRLGKQPEAKTKQTQQQQQQQKQQPEVALDQAKKVLDNSMSDSAQQIEKISPEQAALAAAIEALEPCSVINPINHGFIDLSSLSSVKNDGKALSWTAKGYDAGLNFTLGVCTTPLKHLQLVNEVLDIDNNTEVGAFFIDPKSQKYFSIGQVSLEPVFRGRKLTLTYTGGSYCPGMVDTKTGDKVRRSSVLSFVCDREMLAKASVSYVGSLNDCSYFFEVRSHHACPTAAKADNLAVIWIFLVILLAAVAVYGSGGFLYKHMRKQREKSEK